MSDKRALPKRFYKTVAISDDNRVLLDDRPIKTPMKAALVLPNRALAEAVAAEWQAQEMVIDPSTMTVTRLANTAIDRLPAERNKMIDEITEYAGSDLVCYRATSPERLVTLQHENWDPVITWANAHLTANFKSAEGIMHRQQDEASLHAIKQFATSLSEFELVAIHALMTITGSALLSAMIVANEIDAEAAWKAALTDEDFQIEQWGRDAEAEQRRLQRKQEFDAAARFLDCLRT